MRNTKTIDTEKLGLAFKRLKRLLIIMTIIELSYVFVNSTDQLEIIKFIFQNNIDKILWVLHLLIVGIFIGFIWKKYPVNKKSKWNNTLMILFLGVIGIWLWFPNKKELEELMKL